MALSDRNLTPGTQLVAKYKGTTYTAEVVQTEEGLRYVYAGNLPGSVGSWENTRCPNCSANWALKPFTRL